MAVTNAYTITFGGFAVGGDSDTFLIDGPHVIERNYTSFRLVFDVVVVAESFEDLVEQSQALETAFARRDQDLTIDLDDSPWEFVSGDTILNVNASLVKSGDRERDRGFGRAYTCTVQGELPASDRDGLRDLQVNVTYTPARQRVVMMRGTYTTDDGDTASEAYAANFDAEAGPILTGIDDDATWELVSEDFTRDRLDHQCQFERQYVELLANQSSGALDATQIRDHRITFSEMAQHPGDGQENVHRLRRVYGEYSASVDKDETQNLQDVFESIVRDHVVSLFEANFSPVVFAVEDSRVAYDHTGNRISVALLFVYQKGGGDQTVEVQQSTTMREIRTLDYTPIHRANELAANVDLGWATRERTTTRTAIVLATRDPEAIIAGATGAAIGGGVNRSGWNTISSVVQVAPMFYGDPSYGQQIQASMITETVVERFTESSGSGGGGGAVIQRAPRSLGTV